MSELTANQSSEAGLPSGSSLDSRRLFQFAFAMLAPGLLLAGLIFLGCLARENLRRQQRYTIDFADIECPSPPGQERGDFLDEVRYLAGCPDRLSLLDDNLAEHLHRSFARHPWVEKVTQVETSLPRQVRVELLYRTPVLGVPWSNSDKALLPDRTVDREGILLPKRATGSGIPTLSSRHGIQPPAGPAGTHWGDPSVEAAARLAAVLYPHRDRVEVIELELRDGAWVLHTRFGDSVLWGQPPGRESPGEATTEQKVSRLLDYCQRHERLNRAKGPYEHDVRPPDQMTSKVAAIRQER
jgi:hypothetical protein